MTDMDQITKLANETLDGQRVTRLGDSCLVGNGAATELATYGPAMLTAIEHVIIDRVVPASHEVADHHELMRRFTGLSSLWVTYFRVSRHGHLEEAMAFLKMLEGVVLATAILGMPPIWRYSGGGELPPTFEMFLREIARKPSQQVAEVARQQLVHVWGQTA